MAEDLEKEIEEAAEKGTAKALESLEFPTTIEVSNFPEQKAPIVNVKAPIVKIEAPKAPKAPVVNVKAPIINVEVPPQPENTSSNVLLGKIVDLLEENDPERFNNLEKAVRESKSEYKGGGIGPSKLFIRDESGAVVSPVIQGEQSTVNTSTTLLASGATYTGTFEQNTHPNVGVSLHSDIAGTLYFDFSPDGSAVNTFPVAGFKVTAGIHEFHTAVKLGRYFRVRFVMAAGTQTYMRLYTYYGTTFLPSNTPLNQAIGVDQDAIITRNTLPQHEVRLGFRTGVTGWNKFGYRTGLTGAGGEETVWATTGNYVPPTTATAMRIAYDGTGGGSTDGAGTTGATELTIYYIDSAGLPAILTHTLGTDGSDDTAVTTLGINRVAVSASGTADHNVSAITITAVTGGAKLAVVPVLGSVTQQAIFHTGSNHKALIEHLFINIIAATKTRTVAIRGLAYSRVVDTTYEIFRTNIDTAVELTQQLNDESFVLNQTDVLYFVADSNGDSVNINIRFSLNEYQLS